MSFGLSFFFEVIITFLSHSEAEGKHYALEQAFGK